MLSTREVAGLIWIGLLLLAILGYGPTRRSVPAILRCFARPPILVVIGVYLAWIGGSAYLAHTAGAWNPSMLGPTIMWALLVGMPLIFGMTKAAKDPRWLLHQLRALISVTILLEFMVNFRTFNLAVEFALQGILGFLVLFASVASIRPEHQVVANVTNRLLGDHGFGSLRRWHRVLSLKVARCRLAPNYIGFLDARVAGRLCRLICGRLGSLYQPRTNFSAHVS